MLFILRMKPRSTPTYTTATFLNTVINCISTPLNQSMVFFAFTHKPYFYSFQFATCLLSHHTDLYFAYIIKRNMQNISEIYCKSDFDICTYIYQHFPDAYVILVFLLLNCSSLKILVPRYQHFHNYLVDVFIVIIFILTFSSFFFAIMILVFSHISFNSIYSQLSCNFFLWVCHKNIIIAYDIIYALFL